MPESFMNFTEGSGKKAHTFQRTIGSNTVEDEVVAQGEPYLAAYTGAIFTAVSMATAASHLFQLMAGASLNVYLRSIDVYQFGPATAAAITSLQLFRLTSAGTGGTVFTPQLHDISDSAAGATLMTLPTVKGTETANPFGIKAAQLIQTVPTGGPGTGPLLAHWDWESNRVKAFRISAGVANGFAIKNPVAIPGATLVFEVRFSEANF